MKFLKSCKKIIFKLCGKARWLILALVLVLIADLIYKRIFGRSMFELFVLESLTYHGLGLGFIALAWRHLEGVKGRKARRDVFHTATVTVGGYLIQAIVGLAITTVLFYLIGSFAAGGILLPMGYGQGPGQANNVGTSYQNLGFTGGRSFGLAIAAAGYLCACIVGVILLNVLAKRGSVSGVRKENDDHLEVDFFQNKNELPVSDSIDRLSVQLAMVLVTYAVTFFATWGLTSGLSAISEGLGKTLNTLLWGFNFIIGSAIAILLRALLEKGRRAGIIVRQYQNNYLLNRISGFFFDIMIVAGISSINIEDLSGLWLPFVLIAVAGGVITWLFLKKVCKWAYPDYFYEGLISMYGMMTGTISSGILLLREIDSDLSTPAANNLVSGSSVGIILGAPVLVLVSLAARSDLMTGIVMLIAAVYMTVLLLALHRISFGKRK